MNFNITEPLFLFKEILENGHVDMRKLSVLVLLDLNSAFDTVDHTIPLKKLQNLIGISGTVFNWFKLYLTVREFYVTMQECLSKSYKLDSRVPQGSI